METCNLFYEVAFVVAVVVRKFLKSLSHSRSKLRFQKENQAATHKNRSTLSGADFILLRITTMKKKKKRRMVFMCAHCTVYRVRCVVFSIAINNNLNVSNTPCYLNTAAHTFLLLALQVIVYEPIKFNS